MNWYKAYHGMPYHAKLAVAAKRCGQPRALALAVWVALLDHASRQKERGSLCGIDAEEIAVALDMDPGVAAEMIEAFRAKGMITEDGTITSWKKRQDTSTPRVRAHRARQKLFGRRP